MHPEDRAEALQAVTEGAAAGRDFAFTYRVRAADGRVVWIRDLVHVVTDEAGHRRLHGVLIDITEQKRLERAAALLAAAGRVLSGGGGVQKRLGAVMDLAVGELGDWASVWLREDDDRYRVVAAARPDAAKRMLSLPPIMPPEELVRRFADAPPFTVGDVAEQMSPVAAADQNAAVARFGARSRLLAPLVANGELVGLLSCSSADPGRRYDDADLALADDLGQRIATTVAAERLAERQRHLHELTVALAAAGTAAGAAAALASGLHQALGASVVSVFTLGADNLLHMLDVRGYPAERRGRFAVMRLSAPFPSAVAARTGQPVWLTDRASVAERFPEAAPHLLPSDQGAAALPRWWAAGCWVRWQRPSRCRGASEPRSARFCSPSPTRRWRSSGRRWPTCAGRWPTPFSAACCRCGCRTSRGWRSPPATCRRWPAPRPAGTGTTCTASTTAGWPSRSATWSRTGPRRRP